MHTDALDISSVSGETSLYHSGRTTSMYFAPLRARVFASFSIGLSLAVITTAPFVRGCSRQARLLQVCRTPCVSVPVCSNLLHGIVLAAVLQVTSGLCRPAATPFSRLPCKEPYRHHDDNQQCDTAHLSTGVIADVMHSRSYSSSTNLQMSLQIAIIVEGTSSSSFISAKSVILARFTVAYLPNLSPVVVDFVVVTHC